MAARRSVVILAGGSSRRMGADKWLLPLGGEPVLSRLVRSLDRVGDEIAIVLPWGASDTLRRRAVTAVLAVRPETPVRWLTDEEPDAGPLAGLKAAATSSGIGGLILATAADMPFARRELAESLFRRCDESGAEAVVPERGGRRHPLFAVYAASAFDRLQAYRRIGGRKVMEWLENVNVEILPEGETAALDPEGTALFNMNTPDDYERAQTIVDAE